MQKTKAAALSLSIGKVPGSARGSLLVLFVCLFVVMIGFGIAMPVMPFFTERLARAAGTTRRYVPLHIDLLTGVYALMQLIGAPLWGRYSDPAGRKRMLLLGITGSAAAQLLFGVSNSLWLLYAARALGGALSAATIPAASAYVADITTAGARARGMAWLRTAIGFGSIAGLALGGFAARKEIHLK